MKSLRNKRLCWNCDGEVHKQAVKCNYCGAELSPQNISEAEAEHIKAPYKLESEADINVIPEPPYTVNNDESFDSNLEASVEAALGEDSSVAIEGVNDFKAHLIPMILLPLGMLFVVFSIFMLFFSREGMLIISWTASNWWVYLSLGFLSSFVGWRYLSKL